MNEKQAQRLIDYVSSMTDYYDNEPDRVMSELEERGSQTDEALQQIYSSIEGQAFCNSCSNLKLRDERQEEYYCPMCG